jgi:hypothetical protein
MPTVCSSQRSRISSMPTKSTHQAADRYRAVARNYLDDLAQFMTPGHLGELTDQL